MSLLAGMARAAIVAAGAGLGLVIASAVEPPGSGPYLASVDLARDGARPPATTLPPGAEIVDEDDRRVLRAVGETPEAAAALATAAAYTVLWSARDPTPSAATAAPDSPAPSRAPPATDLSERLDAIRTRDEASATLRRLGDADDPERLASAQGLPPAVEAAAARYVAASIAAADAQDVYGPRHPSRTAALRQLENARERLLAAADAAREEARAALDAARARLASLDRAGEAEPGGTAAHRAGAQPAATSVPPSPPPAPPLLAPQVEASLPGTALPWEPIGAGAGALVAYLLTAVRLPRARRVERPSSRMEAAVEPPLAPPAAPVASPVAQAAAARRAPPPRHDPAALAATWDRLAEALAAGERVRVLVHAEELDAGGAPAAIALADAGAAAGLRVLLVDASAADGILSHFDLGEDAQSVGRIIDLHPVLAAQAVRLPHLADPHDPRGWRAEHASCMLRLVETTFDLVVVATPHEPSAPQVAMLAGDAATLAFAPHAAVHEADRSAA